jgi:hypothetical protein
LLAPVDISVEVVVVVAADGGGAVVIAFIIARCIYYCLPVVSCFPQINRRSIVKSQNVSLSK